MQLHLANLITKEISRRQEVRVRMMLQIQEKGKKEIMILEMLQAP
jgi:hypothetical protein